jgi:uncharacterized protein (DUF4415 family)
MSKVKYKQSELPPLTEERKAALKRLAEMPDTAIDYSDILELPPNAMFLKNIATNPLYKPRKTHASVRIDADVMAWLKAEGKGYQTRINAILREAMIHSLPLG